MSEIAITPAPSPNFEARAGHERPDMVVLHYTGMADGAAALAKLRDPDPRMKTYRAALPPAWREGADDAYLGRASAHYLIEADGGVFQLVAEDQAAWHAGKAFWAGASDINARSIGIELVNGGHDFDLPGYPDAQIDAVIGLLGAILKRHDIAPWRVVGHSDVAPERKLDPGEHFPWRRLEAAGAALSRGAPRAAEPGGREALWRHGDAGARVKRLQRRLEALGYGLADSGGYDKRTEAAVAAFQRRWAEGEENGSAFGVWRRCDERRLADIFQSAAALAARAAETGRSYAVPPPHDPD